jgi:hypothetical protein
MKTLAAIPCQFETACQFETVGRRRDIETDWQGKKGPEVRVEMNGLMQKHLFARMMRWKKSA